MFLVMLSTLTYVLVYANGDPRNHRTSSILVKQGMSHSSDPNNLSGKLKDAIHGVKMGVTSDLCDNAIDNLDVDWDGSPVNYTCYHPKDPLPVLERLNAVQECYLPNGYFPKHVCMSEKIPYSEIIPTYGNHRPLWPVYGEYVFLPPQRWLHSLEHGAIVMLYHPCAEPLEIEHLRILLKNCLRRYIITPSKLVPAERPLALLSWGCKLLMNNADADTVIQFIKNHALVAPEGNLPKQGQYKYKLIEESFTVPGSTYQDSVLCPSI